MVYQFSSPEQVLPVGNLTIRMGTYFYDASGEQYSYTNTYTMVYYAGFYLKFTFSGNNVTCYAAITPTSLILPQSV